MQEKIFEFIIVRIKTNTWVIFEDEFIEKNPYVTQNRLIEILKLLYSENDFEVRLMVHQPKK